jgi:hypothetical protein
MYNIGTMYFVGSLIKYRKDNLLQKYHNCLICNVSLLLKYLGTTVTNQSSTLEETESRLQSGNACYHSAQNFMSSSLLSKSVKIKIYRTIILPVVLYGCETWSLTVRKGCRLRVFENRVLRRMFGPKKDEVTGEWRRLHNEELCALYFSPNTMQVIKLRRLRWAGHVARVGESTGACTVLTAKPYRRNHLKDPDLDGRIILQCTLKKWNEDIYWIDPDQGRDRWRALVNAAMNFRVS